MSTPIPGATGDPLPAPALTEGVWQTTGAGHRLIHIGRDTVLDWVPASGTYRVWKIDRAAVGGADPLPGPALAQGQWSRITNGHELVYLGEDRLLDWQPSEKRFRVWLIDRAATGSADPLPGEPQTGGLWSTIEAGHQIISLEGDRVLVWAIGTGAFRVFRHDPAAVGAADPLPGPSLAQGTWGLIRAGHRLIPLGPDRVLDWVPATGVYRVLRHDRSATGDPFAGEPVVSGQWITVREGHELVFLDGDRVLDWEPATRHFRLWRYDRNITTLRRTTVRLHLKILTPPPSNSIETMVANARALYASYGIDLVDASREVLNAGDGSPLAHLQTLHIGECKRTEGPTAHQVELFNLRGNAGPRDIVVYFVRGLVPDKTGCATHPPERPGAVIAARQASEWTLAHEIGHVLGLDHILVDDTNRLMNGRSTLSITNPPPDLVAAEIATIIASPISQE